MDRPTEFACPEDQKTREQVVAELNEAIRILEKSGEEGEGRAVDHLYRGKHPASAGRVF